MSYSAVAVNGPAMVPRSLTAAGAIGDVSDRAYKGAAGAVSDRAYRGAANAVSDRVYI